MSDGFCGCGCGERTKIAAKTSASEGIRKGEPRRFLQGHASRLRCFEGDDFVLDPDTGCWVWARYVTDEGYGRLRLGGRRGSNVLAHRLYYERLVGPIPEGLVIDHLCRNRACVNPDHLEPVTLRENILRGEGRGAKSARRTHCIHGHPLSGANLYVSPTGRRRCRACKATKGRAA